MATDNSKELTEARAALARVQVLQTLSAPSPGLRRNQMGTKNNPGRFDCYANAEPDEPMFVLLARDPLAPMLVRLWADLRAHLAGNPSKVSEARSCASAMESWKSNTALAGSAPRGAQEPKNDNEKKEHTK